MTGGALRATAHIALGVTGFLLGAAALRSQVPRPDEFGLAEKLDHLAAHGDDYDAVVLGSSASQFGVRPAVLDAALARLAAAGCEVLLFVPPVDRSTAEAYRLAERGELPAVLGFNAPSRFPTLYLLDRRFDDVHLNERGADEFSTLLARAAAHGPLAHGEATAVADDEGAR